MVFTVFQAHAGKGPGLGSVCHIPMCPSFCEATRKVVLEAAASKGAGLPEGVRVHDKGTMVTCEGPRFSSRAESK